VIPTISVIICTHNPRTDYLHRVLEALRAQTLAQHSWELLLIDNASAQPLAEEWDLGWHSAARHIREDELGLAPARLRGIAEAKGELLVFVDDDNVLAPDFLAEALRIGHEWPILGIWGGSIIPEFEIEPPGHLRPFLHAVAMVEVKSPRWSNVINCPDVTVCGAGMCQRADVAAAYRRFYNASDIRLTDRSGEDLLSGGDVEIGHVACGLGFGIGRFPDLQLTHLIPRHRLAEEYLIRLTEGIETSNHLLNFKWNGVLPRASYSGIELLRFMKHVIVRRGVDRRMYLARRRGMRRARTIVRKASNPKTRQAMQCSRDPTCTKETGRVRRIR
jgi:glycosyltransferase involved in cell wall biosynthesis